MRYGPGSKNVNSRAIAFRLHAQMNYIIIRIITAVSFRLSSCPRWYVACASWGVRPSSRH